jgi:murein DD-endopeptidase MepM/ murein hydrolase activator NlpD
MRPPTRPVRTTAGLAAIAALASLLLAACGGPSSVLRERLAPSSPHERYAASLRDAGLDASALGRDWLSAAELAVGTAADAPLPLREAGTFAAGEARAVAWRVAPRRGQRVRVRVTGRATPPAATPAAPAAPARLFVDAFRLPPQAAGDTAAPRPDRVAGAEGVVRGSVDGAADSLVLEFEAEDEGTYVVRLQPELLRGVAWSVTAESGPSLATFPVEGRDAGAVRSFWGADRDGGARSHQGVDIFAPRGTPVVATTAGIVRSAGTNALGGNVIFLYDPARGQSYYYAHLDRQAVSAGQQVAAGDTLGFVGNTGNARTTAPHLHFGIYRRGEGAIDPFPWIDTRRPRVPALAARDSALAGQAVRTAGAVALRAGPAERAAVTRRLAARTAAVVDGAAAGWLRVRLADGTPGYLPAGGATPVRVGD